MTRLLLVLSPGRSGSSAIAGALHAAGVWFGPEHRLIGPHPEHNPWGHFENRDIYFASRYHAYNVARNNILGTEFEDVHLGGWEDDSMDLGREIHHVVDSTPGPIVGIKDMFIHTWPSHILENYDTRLIMIHRPYLEVVHSRAKHSNLSPQAAHKFVSFLLSEQLRFISKMTKRMYIYHAPFDLFPLKYGRLMDSLCQFVTEEMEVELDVDKAKDWIRWR